MAMENGQGGFGKAFTTPVDVSQMPRWAVGAIAVLFALGTIADPILSRLYPPPLPGDAAPVQVLKEVSTVKEELSRRAPILEALDKRTTEQAGRIESQNERLTSIGYLLHEVAVNQKHITEMLSDIKKGGD